MTMSKELLPEFDMAMVSTRRLVDVPVPAIYGPSADERVPGF